MQATTTKTLVAIVAQMLRQAWYLNSSGLSVQQRLGAATVAAWLLSHR